MTVDDMQAIGLVFLAVANLCTAMAAVSAHARIANHLNDSKKEDK